MRWSGRRVTVYAYARPTDMRKGFDGLCALVVQGLQNAAKDAGSAFSAQSVGGMFGVYFRAVAPESYAQVMECDKNAFNRFFHAMLAQGVYLAPSAFEAGFISAAHGEAEISATIKAASAAFAKVAAA